MPPVDANEPSDDIDEVVPGTSLEGLGKMWENDETIRGRALATKSMLYWPTSEQVGVITFDTMKYNVRVLMILLEKWAPQVDSAKTVCIDQLRAEVWFLKMFAQVVTGIWFLQGMATL